MTPNDRTTENFVQEYLYIEEYPEDIPQKAETNQPEEEIERGVIIIDLFNI